MILVLSICCFLRERGHWCDAFYFGNVYSVCIGILGVHWCFLTGMYFSLLTHGYREKVLSILSFWKAIWFPSCCGILLLMLEKVHFNFRFSQMWPFFFLSVFIQGMRSGNAASTLGHILMLGDISWWPSRPSPAQHISYIGSIQHMCTLCTACLWTVDMPAIVFVWNEIWYRMIEQMAQSLWRRVSACAVWFRQEGIFKHTKYKGTLCVEPASQKRVKGVVWAFPWGSAQRGHRLDWGLDLLLQLWGLLKISSWFFFQSDSWYWVLVTKKAPPCTSKRRCVVLSKAMSSLISLRTGTQSHLLLSPLATSSRDFRCRLGKFIVLWLLPLLLYLLYLVWGTTVSLNCVVKVDQQQQEEIWKKTCDRKGLGSAPCRKETERPNIYKYIQNSFKAGRDQFSAGSWDVNRDEFRLQQREETAE